MHLADSYDSTRGPIIPIHIYPICGGIELSIAGSRKHGENKGFSYFTKGAAVESSIADMNEVYAHTETARREQPTIYLQHMGRGPNDCRRQPRPQFAVAEGKIKAETQQYKEDQFRALEDRREASPTQISNLYRHNGNGSRNPSAERRTHGSQHHAQAHSTRWVDEFKLKIP